MPPSLPPPPAPLPGSPPYAALLAHNQALTAQLTAAAASAQAQAHHLAHYQQIFDQTPAAICIFRGPLHRYDYVNDAYQALFPDREFLGRPVAEALPETVDGGFVALLDEVYRSGITYFGHESAFTPRQPDGSPGREMFFTFTFQTFQEQGQTVGISNFAYDVTEQVLARRALEAQQRQVQELFETAPVAIALFRGPQHVIELANPAICALWGRSQAQAVGTPLFTLLPEVVGQGFEELLDGVLATGVPYVAHEMPGFIDRNGRREAVYWNFVYQPLREADGRVSGIMVVANEASEQLRARRTLAEQQKLQAVFEQAPVAIGVFSGPDYVVDVCNPGLEPIWGRTAAQALGRPLFEVLPEVREQGFKELLDEVRRTGVPFVAREMTALLPDENRQPVTRHLDFVYQPLRDAEGHISAVIAVVSDVTAQVAARRQVQTLNIKLAALNDKLFGANAALADANENLHDTNGRLIRTVDELDTFVYTASHDLKAPITNIEGLLHALRQDLPPASRASGDVAHVLALMQDSVDRFKTTLGHLSDISHLQQERDQPRPPGKPAPHLADVVRDVLLDLAPLLKETGGTVDVDVDNCPVLPFSEKNLRSVVYNLVSNALKYHHPARPPRVRIHCRIEEPHWVLDVQDNGLGLALSPDRPMFALFQRYHTHVEGSGVGLYMVKKMVENAGGKISVTSELGVGSTFSVYFLR